MVSEGARPWGRGRSEFADFLEASRTIGKNVPFNVQTPQESLLIFIVLKWQKMTHFGPKERMVAG